MYQLSELSRIKIKYSLKNFELKLQKGQPQYNADLVACRDFVDGKRGRQCKCVHVIYSPVSLLGK